MCGRGFHLLRGSGPDDHIKLVSFAPGHTRFLTCSNLSSFSPVPFEHRLSSHKRSIRSYCQNAVYQVSSYSRLLLTSLFSTVASMAEVAQTTTVSISLAASGVSVSRTTTQTSRQTSIYTSQDRSVPRSAATMGCYASRCCQCGTMLVISDSCIDCRHKQCQTCEPRY